ncbi:MAG: hypothetical protein ACRDSK_23745 [Actinophytocola sp.]|uniref:hypothetical protein n=1 Tax=Actinophytocola sp. TaxID=1872138 RepID=UPI003D6A8438
MAADERDTRMRAALSAALPADEPPVGLDVADIMRRGRRRYRVRRAVPIAVAASVAAVLAAVPLAIDTDDPAPERLPIGVPSSTAPPPSAPPTSGTSSDSGAPFRAPPGHHRSPDADTLAANGAAQLPGGNVAAHFGTRSDVKGSGDRFGFGMHVLWREGDRRGYLAVLHRTSGDFPASVYGMPDEPCLTAQTRRPEYGCEPVPVPVGGVAYSFEIEYGYRVRGVVWDQPDPAGGADIRVTAAFLIPGSFGWTPFRALDDAPRMTDFPLTTEELGDLIKLPR